MGKIAKLITFLGTGSYRKVTYVFPSGEKIKGDLFPEILVKHLYNDGFSTLEVIVLVSEEVLKHDNWKKLQMALQQFNEKQLSWKSLVYDWNKQEKLWSMLTVLDKEIKEGDKLILDITHSFRSVPFIMVMILNYLEKVKKAEIGNIYYGNFEARNDETMEAPVFEISQFMKSLDWTFAVDFFLRTGNARLVVEHLKETNDKLFRSGSGSVQLGSFAHHIDKFSSSLINLDWKSAREERGRIEKFDIEKLKKDVEEKIPFAVPLIEELFNFAINLKIGKENWDELNIDELEGQLNLIKWYFEYGYYRHAVLLTKEFVINCWLYVNEKRSDWLKKEVRQPYEENLTKIIYKLKAKESVVRTVNSVLDIRNAVAHALMKDVKMPKFKKIEDIIKKIDLEEFLNELRQVKEKYKEVLNVQG